jgi:hypothetical protein
MIFNNFPLLHFSVFFKKTEFSYDPGLSGHLYNTTVLYIVYMCMYVCEREREKTQSWRQHHIFRFYLCILEISLRLRQTHGADINY